MALDEKVRKAKRDEMIRLASISGGTSAYGGIKVIARFYNGKTQASI
jgi:mevalonate pyrophosphate decarboxylase